MDQHPYYLFGRDAQVADFVLEHPSASRVHAALVHHHSGSKFLIDLGTKYGTRRAGRAAARCRAKRPGGVAFTALAPQVNGARINSMEPVRLGAGDRIRFAESSREYTLKREGFPVPTLEVLPGKPCPAFRRLLMKQIEGFEMIIDY